MVYLNYMAKTPTLKFNNYNPRRNLPPSIGKKRGESNFLGSFERYLIANMFNHGFGGRHFYLGNYGIADFIWILPAKKKVKHDCHILYAFETKIKDWRRAFQQAYRYSYYSDVSFVILPPATSKVAQNYLPLFKTNNIGLWSYDSKENSLEKILTPRKTGPRNKDAKIKALSIISSRVNFS